MFDTYLQRLGLTFSTSLQCTWYTNRRNLWNDGMPVSYIDQSGETYPFRAEDAENIQLQHLVKSIRLPISNVPPCLSHGCQLKGKRIGKYLNLSFYVNCILGIYPDYTLEGSIATPDTGIAFISAWK